MLHFPRTCERNAAFDSMLANMAPVRRCRQHLLTVSLCQLSGRKLDGWGLVGSDCDQLLAFFHLPYIYIFWSTCFWRWGGGLWDSRRIDRHNIFERGHEQFRLGFLTSGVMLNRSDMIWLYLLIWSFAGRKKNVSCDLDDSFRSAEMYNQEQSLRTKGRI